MDDRSFTAQRPQSASEWGTRSEGEDMLKFIVVFILKLVFA